jgi:thiamine pyrophosphate-dependent acetolactate synthase large subunit-like protein
MASHRATGAESLVRRLEREGVRYVFGVPIPVAIDRPVDYRANYRLAES